MSVCPLVDLFQKNLELSAVFGLSMCMATAENPTFQNEYILLGFFCFRGVGGYVREKSTKKVRMQVNAEKIYVLMAK